MTAVDVHMRKRRADARYTDRTQQKNAARSEKRAHAPRTFIGVDGEGVTRNNRHDYVLLSVGTESLHKNGEPLAFEDVAVFLWDQFIAQGSDAIFVGFYLSYDFTMWLRSLPSERARMLLTEEGIKKRVRKIGQNPVPFPVEYNGWEFDLHAGKRFKLRLRGDSRWLYVCDVGPFFQTSFLAAINPKSWPTPILTEEEYERIREGKENRSAAQFDNTMVRYNTLENDVLGRVMQKLDGGFSDMGVRLRKTQWYGPGQSAQAWLNNISAPTRDDVSGVTPPSVMEAAQASYYGGWFEIMMHGHIPGVVYEYDINSAYPYIIASLPCFLHGRWTNGNASGTTLVNATVFGSNPYVGVHPHRTADGVILRPRVTKSWMWKHELDAAIRAGAIDHVAVHSSYSYRQSCNHAPFSAIKDLYYQRQMVGKDTPMGKALKLVYNSSYGKAAQSVGEPKYANPLAASLITAGCRTMVWDAIASHPQGAEAVTMVATDGVFFRSPHPHLPISNKLGEWDVTEKHNLTQFMPGVYWDDKTRASEEGKIRSRGISARDLRNVVADVDRDFRLYPRLFDGTYDPALGPLGKMLPFDGEPFREFITEWPHVKVPISFGLISAKLALHRNDWSQAGTISTKPRLISSNPSDKRDVSTTYWDRDVLRTQPYERPPGGIESVPYDKRFGMELQRKIVEDDILTEDGTVDDELYEYVQGGQ